MRKQTNALSKDIARLTDDARALIDATAEVAGDKVGKARKRLVAALERGKSAGEDLMDRTTDRAREDVGEVRQLLADTLEHGKEIYGDVYDKVVEKAKETDQKVRENPYQTIGIALGVGALLGYLASFRSCRRGD